MLQPFKYLQIILTMNQGMKLKDSTIKAIGITNFYEFYFSTFYKEVNGNWATINNKSKYYVTRKAYVNLISDYNKAIMEEIIYDNFEFNMPA